MRERVRKTVEEAESANPTTCLQTISMDNLVSTGSTLLDLAISGRVSSTGGLPGGILVEVSGPSGTGKTGLLCEIAANVKRKGGSVLFKDPEGRLNSNFAQFFGYSPDSQDFDQPDTILEVFSSIRDWDPPKKPGIVNAVFADSLAALSTEAEQEDKDAYGMRRAKEFSQELRKTCRVISKTGVLVVCSNQVRSNVDGGLYGPKTVTPGGMAVPFYSSLRISFGSPAKLTKKKTINGRETSRVFGIHTEATIIKSSLDAPYRSAPLYLIFDYGLDDIRANLQWLKDNQSESTYFGGYRAMEAAVDFVEADSTRQAELRNEVILLWKEIDEKFKNPRPPKIRW